MKARRSGHRQFPEPMESDMTDKTQASELSDKELDAATGASLTEIFGVKRLERLDKPSPKGSGEAVRGGYYAYE